MSEMKDKEVWGVKERSQRQETRVESSIDKNKKNIAD